MRIALIGATGYTGSRILAEALARGHTVTAIARNVAALQPHPALACISLDVHDADALAASLAGHDAVVSAFNPAKDSGGGTAAIVAATRQAGVARLLVVGGAGSLEVAPGQLLVDQPDFPAAWKEGALKTAAFLATLRQEEGLEWSFLSPAARLSPGQRTGVYRVGGDQLLRDATGESRISCEDLAVAMLDEVERPRHARRRFTVAY
jgi:hypothetical protein